MDLMSSCDGSGDELQGQPDTLLDILERSTRRWRDAHATALQGIREAQRCEEDEYAKLRQEYSHLKRQFDELKDKCSVEAAKQNAGRTDTEHLVREIRLLKVQDRDMLERAKSLSDGFDEKSASNTVQLLSLATDIDMQWCNETQDLKGVVHKYSATSTPLLQRTTGLSRCEVADCLWNLTSTTPFKDL